MHARLQWQNAGFKACSVCSASTRCSPPRTATSGWSIYYAGLSPPALGLTPLLRHHGDLLLLHGGDLRRGDGDVPQAADRRASHATPSTSSSRSSRLARCQLRHHGRDLGLLRADYLGGLFWEPLRSAPGDVIFAAGVDHRAVADQRRRHQGARGAEHRPRGRRLLHAAVDGRRRRAARSRRRRSPTTSAPGSRRPGRTSCSRSRWDDRLHRDRDDLEHGRGGQGRGDHDPQGDRPGAHRRLRDLLHAAGRGAVGAAGHARSADRRAQHAARRRRGARRLRRRPDPRRRQAASPRHPAAARGALRRPARRDDPAHRDERRHHRRVTPRLLDGYAPPGPRPPAPAAPEVQHALDRDPRLRRRRLRHAAARTGRVPRQHVRVRRDAVVHDRPRGGHPSAAGRARARASLPRSRHGADRRPRAAGLRRLRRRRDGAVVRRRHRPEPGRRGGRARSGWRSASPSTPCTGGTTGSTSSRP